MTAGAIGTLLLAAVVAGTALLPSRETDSALDFERKSKFHHGASLPEDSGVGTRGIVALRPIPPSAAPPIPGTRPRATLEQMDKTFVPSLLPIVVGTVVDFPNLDPIFHNVFSYSKTKRFDLGRYAGEESRSVTFDKPGVVRVFCEIHSFMNATIVVLPAPWFSTVDEAGWFEIRDVPAGEYEVLLWYEGESDLGPVRELSVAQTDSVRMRLAP